MELSELLNRLRWGYGVAFFTAFVVGLLLLFYGQLSPFWQDTFIPSLVVYAMGDALIATIRVEFTRSANTKARADARIRNEWKPERFQRGLSDRRLAVFSVLHGAWFVAFLMYSLILILA